MLPTNDLADIAANLADFLHWQVEPYDSTYQKPLVNNTDQPMRLWLSLEGKAQDRLSIAADSLGFYNYLYSRDEHFPRITVSLKRHYHVIAKEVERRVIEPYKDLLFTCTVRKRKEDARTAAMRQIAREAAAILHSEPRSMDSRNPHVYTYGSETTSFEVEVESEKLVTVKIDRANWDELKPFLIGMSYQFLVPPLSDDSPDNADVKP